MRVTSSPVATRSLRVESTGRPAPTVLSWYTRALPSAAEAKMSFHRDRSSENPFLLGVTTDTPFLRNVGYWRARLMSEVLSTRMARPGAEARYVAISSAWRAPFLVKDGVAEAVAQSAAGMAGE